MKKNFSKEIREYEGEKLDSVNDSRENSIKGPQHIDIKNYKLKIYGLVEKPRSYTYDEVLAHKNYKKILTLNCVEGWDVKILWEGILLKDLFDEVKPLPKAKVVIFHSYDGYTTSLPLDYLLKNKIILAYKMNDVPLPPERGFPFHLIAESKWGYKWARWVTEIEFSEDENYKGYWESAGYSQSGDLNKNFLER